MSRIFRGNSTANGRRPRRGGPGRGAFRGKRPNEIATIPDIGTSFVAAQSSQEKADNNIQVEIKPESIEPAIKSNIIQMETQSLETLSTIPKTEPLKSCLRNKNTNVTLPVKVEEVITIDDSKEQTEVQEIQDTNMENVEENIGTKRKDISKNPPRKKMKSEQIFTPKNPLMKLNEIKPGLSYIVVSQEGPSHNPTFKVSVELDGQTFHGKGRSKQDAKHSAALAALSSFVQFKNQTEISQMMPINFQTGLDFTTDAIEMETAFNISEHKQKLKLLQQNTNISTDKTLKVQKLLLEFDKKSPVMLLNEIHPGSEYSLIEEVSDSPSHRFTMAVTVNGHGFEGSGQSKKLAKAAAARSALSFLYDVPHRSNTPTTENYTVAGLNQTVADKIANMVFEKFNEIIAGFEENKKWKVLSGLVMTTDLNMEEAKVIGVSTGTKCIGGEHISMNGAALNDCHAEIISRRCFKDFLYEQLEMHTQDRVNESVLTPKGNGLYVLKENVKFHLFISTSPCGDARIFSPHEICFEEGVDKHPNRKGRGVLRTKIEAGEGTIPVKSNEALQTWDGIQGGQRLLTMSCSDKIARWNVLGLQGTLLSLLVEPIYLESIVLGSMYHEEHMYRAMGKRIESNLKLLPEFYKLSIPKFNLVSSTEARQPTKSPSYCVNWTVGQFKPEIINVMNGKLHNGQISRLSKRSFFSRFIKLSEDFNALKAYKPNSLYSEVKRLALDYLDAKEKVFDAFKESGLGCWVKKPQEQDEFEL